MHWASRSLCTVLAVLLVFAGGALDLCACDASSHGAFCADEGAEAVAPCHGESAPAPAAPSVAHGCCGAAEPVPSGGEALRAAGCGCPVLVLEQPPSESPVTSIVGFDRTSDLCVASATLLVGWAPPADEEVWAEPWRRPPRAPALRRHLELHVLRR